MQLLIGNSLNCFISSIKIFIKRSLSEKPTRQYKPEGCIAMLNASSENSRYISNALKIIKIKFYSKGGKQAKTNPFSKFHILIERSVLQVATNGFLIQTSAPVTAPWWKLLLIYSNSAVSFFFSHSKIRIYLSFIF